MKKTLALLLALVMALMLAACTGGGSSSTGGGGGDSAGGASVPTEGLVTPKEKPKVVILTNSGYGDEPWANVIFDQLQKAGFDPEISLQPDYASWRAQVDARNFDIAITYWNTVTGSPDYAVRAVWHSEGALNLYGINDPELDRLIELGATQTPEEYMQTYSDYEDHLVDEMAYVAPIYVSIKTHSFNSSIMKPESMRVSKSRAVCLEEMRFNDESKNDTEPMILSQIHYDLTPVDPVRSDDGSTFTPITNMYIRLVNLTDTDEITTDSALAREYAIDEEGDDFYFLLRDDVFFTAVENGHAVDTGERVGAEDAVYSMDRMRDKDCVPDHKNWNNFEAMDTMDVFTDLDALKTIKTKAGESVFDVLSKKAPTEIKSLTGDKAEADNAAGVYQVAHLKTKFAFPQILNVLAHSSGGIVSQTAIEKVNAKYLADPASYDVQTDALYGEQSFYTEGATYNNNLVCSGPYIAVKKTDYALYYEANPHYMPTEDKFTPKIKHVEQKFIKDMDNALSALRAGEIYSLYSVPAAKLDLVREDPNLTLIEIPGNAYNYCAFNFDGKFENINLRKALQYAIDQEQISAVFNNRLIPTYSSITPVLGTGKALKADPDKVAYYLSEWAKETGNV